MPSLQNLYAPQKSAVTGRKTQGSFPLGAYGSPGKTSSGGAGSTSGSVQSDFKTSQAGGEMEGGMLSGPISPASVPQAKEEEWSGPQADPSVIGPDNPNPESSNVAISMAINMATANIFGLVMNIADMISIEVSGKTVNENLGFPSFMGMLGLGGKGGESGMEGGAAAAAGFTGGDTHGGWGMTPSSAESSPSALGEAIGESGLGFGTGPAEGEGPSASGTSAEGLGAAIGESGLGFGTGPGEGATGVGAPAGSGAEGEGFGLGFGTGPGFGEGGGGGGGGGGK